MPQNNDILKRGLVKQQRRFRHQGIKPASGLVYGLRDKLSRELSLKQFLILKRIMMLRKRHGP